MNVPLQWQPNRSWQALAGGALAGAAISAVATMRSFGGDDLGFTGIFSLWDLWLFHGLIAGTVVGGLVWILAAPRSRCTRAVVCAIGLNWAAWGAFLLFTPPVPSSEFAETDQKRLQRDAGAGLDLWTDQPTVVAGRFFGGFRSMPLSSR
jgi:hypothetical protein